MTIDHENKKKSTSHLPMV